MTAPVELATVKRVSTRPSKNSLSFCVLLLGLWYAALSQGNGAAYALLFFVASMGLVSWLYSRRNLRGIGVRIGRIEPVFAGGELRFPIRIAAPLGSDVSGIEVRCTQSGEVARCGHLESGDAATLEIVSPAALRGVSLSVEVELRSMWPLGIFTSRARLTLAAPHVVHPAPGGSQPLPESAPGWKHDRRKGKGDGDEFAGLREFRAGESPRRIDWRAAERSEKLLIKEWEGSSGGVQWLEWNGVEAADSEARVAQMTRWVLECDRTGVPYGMRLPGVEVPPSMGPAQKARCLRLLAAIRNTRTQDKPPKRKRKITTRDSSIPAGVFGAALVVLGLSAAPLLGELQALSILIFAGAIAVRFVQRRGQAPLRNIASKLLVCGLGIGSVYLTGGGFVGLGPGMSLLVGLVALKVLESETRRDFFVLVLLTWFLSLCGLFVRQTFLATMLAVLACVLGGSMLVRLYSEDLIPWRRAFKRTLGMAFYTIPVVALFFLFFPRVQGGVRFSLTPSGMGAAGFSEDFDPGKFTELNQNFDTAFFAEILAGEPPPPGNRYWRGTVLWESRGLSWRRGGVATIEPRVTTVPDDAVRQLIILKPHGARWMFALDRPILPPRGASLEPGGFVQSSSRINRSTRYQVLSMPDFEDKLLPAAHRVAALHVPKNLPPVSRRLAEIFKKAGPPEAIVQTGIRWFQNERFTYSLEPDSYEDMDEFLLRRRGFCAHYAGTFATLMRQAGVPARVVLGYQGGEYNEEARRFIVRQNDAHAWCEVWLDGQGWYRVDLTQQLAPSRIQAGARQYRDSVGAALDGAFRAPKGLQDLFGRVRLAWDELNYHWDLRVVSYDEDAQYEFLANAGLRDVPRPAVIGGMIAAILLALGVCGLFIRRITRAPRDPLAETWAAMCRQMARVSGIAREPWEGPMAYAERVSEKVPTAGPAVAEAAGMYARARFGPSGPEKREMREMLRRLRGLKTR